MENQNEVKEYALETIVSKAIQIPGVKVDRAAFLAKAFSPDAERLKEIVEKGPVAANYSREELSKIANKLIIQRTSESSIVSFVAGIPGGFAMAATIPTDILQFFGMTLRLAQELSYIYGAADIWQDGQVDDEKVRNQLIIYSGVMFGVSGAVSGVHILSNQLAKTTLKQLPKQALTKAFWYPIVKKIGKALGVQVTKSTVAKGISKAIPVVGGALSGGLNFASMMPMAKRLQKALDEATFQYSEAELEKDIIVLENCDSQEQPKETEPSIKEKVSSGIKNVSSTVSGYIDRHSPKKKAKEPEKPDGSNILTNIEQLAKLKDMGAITQEEFDEKKKELLAKL